MVDAGGSRTDPNGITQKGSMKILVINWQDWTNPLSGGAEIHLYETFRRVAAAGHEVTLFCSLYEGAAERERIEGIEIIRHGSRNSFNFGVRSYYKRHLKGKFDIVVDDLNKIPFFTPLFVKEPLVAISHHFFGSSIFRETWFLPGLYVVFGEKLVDFVYKRTPFLVVSESTLDEFVRRGFDRENFTLAYNAIDHENLHPTGVPKASVPTVGYFGRLKRYKSVDHVVRAFAEIKQDIPDARLVIIGRGDFRPALESLADELGIADDVEFTGFVSEEEKKRLLQELWVVVNPSMKEGWGIVNVEANACGTPAIAADAPGLRDSVRHRQTGELYPYGEIDALAESMRRILKDDELRSRYREASIEFARSFTWEETAERTIALLEETVARADEKA